MIVIMPNLPFFTFSKPEILEHFKTSEEGLSDTEAANRLRSYGSNIIAAKKKISPLQIYFEQFKNSLTIILLISTLVILFVYQFGGKEESDLIQAGLIFAIVLMITLLGFLQEFKAEKAIESLNKLLAYKAKVLRNGTEKEINVSEVVPGDIVILEEGMKVPADIRLLQTLNLRINDASLTGESIPSTKSEEKLSGNKQLGDQKNMAFSGTTVVSGRGMGVVVQTGDKTALGKIAVTVARTVDDPTPIQKRLDDIGRILGYVIIGICIIVFVFIMFIAHEFTGQPLMQRIIHSFIASVALAVAAIPEGLPAVVTISLALGTQRMLARNALVRKLNSVETLGSTDIICSDKTGTLTKGEMTVTSVYWNHHLYEVTGDGYETTGIFLENGVPLKNVPFEELLEAGMYCNNAKLDDKNILGDPTEAALLVSAAKAKIANTHFKRVSEIPFSSKRKMMSIIVKRENDYVVYCKGAPEMIVEQCYRIAQGDKAVPLLLADKKDILKVTHMLSGKALRTLAFGYKVLTAKEFERLQHNEKELERGLTFLGIQGMIDPPRLEVKELIEKCKKSGIEVIMITGDHPETAKAIATSIGISGDTMTGNDLDKLSDHAFEKAVQTTRVYARINPDTKLKIVAALQKLGHIVAMTGDGVNDAPALKKADIGIAMGISGTDVAKEASDMVLLDDKFSTIISAIEEGRGIFHNIRKFVVYLLSCNLGEVFIVFFGVIIMQDLVLTATMLLWINVVTDGIPAIALGLDPVEKGIMRYSPRVFQSQIISKRLWIEMVVFSVFIAVFVLGAYVLNLKDGFHIAQGAAFTSLVLFEFLHLYLIRSTYHIKLVSNQWLTVSVLASILIQILIIYTPMLGKLFGIGGLAYHGWTYIGLACVWLYLAYQLMKIAFDKLPFLGNESELAKVEA